MMPPFFRAILVVCMVGSSATLATAHASACGKTDIRGFTIMIDPASCGNSARLETFVKLMDQQLHRIETALSPQQLKQLRTHRIWLDRNKGATIGIRYNPSREWLLETGQDPERYDGIEIGDIDSFIDDYAPSQPYVIFHEFAHAYMNGLSEQARSRIEQVYTKAKTSGKYDTVGRLHQTTERAYAMTDSWEYFAELSEAYFGENDYFPYDRQDLKAFDPDGYALVKDLWQLHQ